MTVFQTYLLSTERGKEGREGRGRGDRVDNIKRYSVIFLTIDSSKTPFFPHSPMRQVGLTFSIISFMSFIFSLQSSLAYLKLSSISLSALSSLLFPSHGYFFLNDESFSPLCVVTNPSLSTNQNNFFPFSSDIFSSSFKYLFQSNIIFFFKF
jgi:hypothetical protein